MYRRKLKALGHHHPESFDVHSKYLKYACFLFYVTRGSGKSSHCTRPSCCRLQMKTNLETLLCGLKTKRYDGIK